MTARRRLGATGIEGVRHPRPQFGQLGPHRRGGEGLGGLASGALTTPSSTSSSTAFAATASPGPTATSTDGARAHRHHLVLHLHGLNDQERLADVDPITRSDGHAEDGAGERRHDRRGGSRRTRALYGFHRGSGTENPTSFPQVLR